VPALRPNLILQQPLNCSSRLNLWGFESFSPRLRPAAEFAVHPGRPYKKTKMQVQQNKGKPQDARFISRGSAKPVDD
jgi:hypothetical protein